MDYEGWPVDYTNYAKNCSGRSLNGSDGHHSWSEIPCLFHERLRSAVRDSRGVVGFRPLSCWCNRYEVDDGRGATGQPRAALLRVSWRLDQFDGSAQSRL